MFLRRAYMAAFSMSLATIFAAGPSALAQSIETPTLPANAKPLAYDVVSVKVNESGSYNMGYHILPDCFEVAKVSLKKLMQTAHGVRDNLNSPSKGAGETLVIDHVEIPLED